MQIDNGYIKVYRVIITLIIFLLLINILFIYYNYEIIVYKTKKYGGLKNESL